MAVISTGPQPQLKLDIYDKKLIFYLSQNSRAPISSLAKKLKISPQRTQYKIERLKKELLEPAIFMNFPLLSIPSYLIFLKDCPKETITALMAADEIYFLMQNIGTYQWALNVVTDDIDQFCTTYLGTSHFEIHPIRKAIPDDYDPFNLKIPPVPLREDKACALDTKDHLLLRYLAEHPTASLLTIHQATSIDRQTIKARIQHYEATNLIQKFRYGINIFKLGCIAYLLRVHITPAAKKQVLASLRSNRYSGFIFASYNTYTMHYLPPGHHDLITFIEDIKAQHPDVQIDVMQNTEFFKVDLVPKKVVDLLTKRIRS